MNIKTPQLILPTHKYELMLSMLNVIQLVEVYAPKLTQIMFCA